VQFLAIPIEVTQQLHEHPFHIQAVGLRPPPAPIYLDRGRLQHLIDAAAAHQIAMQPEAISTGFVATEHRRILGQNRNATSPARSVPEGPPGHVPPPPPAAGCANDP
jgi:hypothetical protein